MLSHIMLYVFFHMYVTFVNFVANTPVASEKGEGSNVTCFMKNAQIS